MSGANWRGIVGKRTALGGVIGVAAGVLKKSAPDVERERHGRMWWVRRSDNRYICRRRRFCRQDAGAP